MKFDIKPGGRDAKIFKTLLFLLIVVISLTIFMMRGRLAQVATWGYVGIFLATFFSSASILFPLPGALIVVAGGSAFDPFLVALIASFGETGGELIGYTAGRTGKHIFLQEGSRYMLLQELMKKYGALIIAVLAAIPNPVFDIVGVLAGVLKFSLPVFILTCYLGKLLKNTVLAYVGGRIN